MLKGSCLCGAVTFEATGSFSPVEVCHCVQCRKWTGHFFANIEVPRDGLVISGEERISWHRSSEKVRRGFCATCGSSLFFDPIDRNKHPWVGIAMGALDTPTGSKIAVNIFTAEKGDYYDIPDGVARTLDHVDFAARDPARSRAFYAAALAPLGIRPVVETDREDGRQGTGFGPGEPAQFYIGGGPPVAGRLHLAFAAQTRAAVDAFHRAALGAGGRDHGQPGLRPHYDENYYAAYVVDPDGHVVEAVCRQPE
jgi:catechol 2,3-dioxygenase-like lactoylglutathione lyase family enzyme